MPEATQHSAHACTPMPDLFGDAPLDADGQAPAATSGQTFKFVGTLTRNAEVRSRPPRDGKPVVPVVCMELKNIEPDGPQLCYAEREFTDGTYTQAEAFAKKFLKGHRATVSAPVTDMRVSVWHPDSIRPHDHL